jgi:hypothetical protein
MNKCDNCGIEYMSIRSSSRYCGDKCKLAYHRRKVSVTNGDDKVSVSLFSYIQEQTVYHRPAVSYETDKFLTRPEPLDVTDTPCPRNRGRYTRLDGTQYQLDCVGQVFELTNGLVYQTIEDVMDAHERRRSQPAPAPPVDEVKQKVEC